MAFWLSAFLILLPQESLKELDSPDPAVARRALEAAIRAGDEKPLEAAAKTSRGARLALAEVRAHKRFGEAYPPELCITYEAKDRPTEEVLGKLSKFIGLRIEPDGSLPRPAWLKETLSISLRDATFLEAVDAIARAVPGWTE